MADIIAKATQALTDPTVVQPWFESNRRKVNRWVRRREIGPLLGGLTAGTLDWNAYTNYLAWRSDDGTVVREINGSEMVLDPSMAGISRELLMYGGREELSASVFRAEIERLAGQVDSPVTVLEIGANIGYYALLEAQVLGPDARILAFEPDPRNVDLLSRSIERNGYGDRIDVDRVAIGNSDDTITFNLLPLSNKSHVNEDSFNRAHRIEQQIDVPQKAVSTVLEERELPPDAINVVRMDVEGYEAQVFEGMESVLESEQPLVVFFELHRSRLDDETIDRMLRTLAAADLEIVAVTDLVGPMWYEVKLPWDSFDDLRGIDEDRSLHLILRRPS
ncbi:FkbM family methyltransferase [Natrinema longum]|uniref:FkbM family methyltransferase n=1 Tax=Natrinema longum TaxID=370324 RepID=A0A8A2U5P5_9EURY|nr:FkbM family methyltransferase [Natrinema longum]MBZ6494611.1 FkbM family methyltransferase [Natrinema longum]QSW84070.1 FkbM family methyltransferase [Natrinema longum]